MSFLESSLFKLLTDKLGDDTIAKVEKELGDGADVNLKGKYQETYLHALMVPRSEKEKNNVSLAPLVIALTYRLCRAGADINAADVEGNTPLHIAAMNDVDPRIITTFLRLGADPSLKNQQGGTPLDFAEVDSIKKTLNFAGDGFRNAVTNSQSEKVKTFVDFWCLIDIDADNRKLSDVADDNGNEDIILYLIEKASTNALVHAVLSADVEKTKEIIKGDVEVETKAICNVHEDNRLERSLICEALLLRSHDCAKLLIDKGVDVNAKIEGTNSNDEPIFVYLLTRDYFIEGDLLETALRKADFSLLTLDHFTVLYGAWRKKYTPGAIDALFEKGISVAVRDKEGYTVRDRILERSYHLDRNKLKESIYFIDEHVINLAKRGKLETLMHLAQEGYDYLRVCDLEGKSIVQLARESNEPQCAAFLETLPGYQRRGFDVHKAIVKGNLTEMKDLIDETNASFRDREGRSPMHVAVLYERSFIVKWLVEQCGETINNTDGFGRTPLHYACALSDGNDIQELLLQAGAMGTLEDKEGRTPIDYSKDPKSKDLVLQQRRLGVLLDIYLLDRYLSMLWAIDDGDTEYINETRETLVCVSVDDFDLVIPEKFPKLQYQPLTFRSLEVGHEDVTILLLKWGADSSVTYQVTKEADQKQTMSVLEAAQYYNRQRVVEYLTAAMADSNAQSEQADAALHAAMSVDYDGGDQETRSGTPDSLKSGSLPAMAETPAPGATDSGKHNGNAAHPPPEDKTQSSACIIL